jgi:hypothetical protein
MVSRTCGSMRGDKVSKVNGEMGCEETYDIHRWQFPRGPIADQTQRIRQNGVKCVAVDACAVWQLPSKSSRSRSSAGLAMAGGCMRYLRVYQPTLFNSVASYTVCHVIRKPNRQGARLRCYCSWSGLDEGDKSRPSRFGDANELSFLLAWCHNSIECWESLSMHSLLSSVVERVTSTNMV